MPGDAALYRAIEDANAIVVDVIEDLGPVENRLYQSMATDADGDNWHTIQQARSRLEQARQAILALSKYRRTT